MTERTVRSTLAVVQWLCTQCGRLAVEVRTPAKADAGKYGPVPCGCGSTTFTKRETV